MENVALRSNARRRGIVYVLALVLLTLFASLAVAFCSTTNLELAKSSNLADSTKARLAAESGMSYMLLVLNGVEMPVHTDGNSLIANLYQAIRAEGGTLAGASLVWDGSAYRIDMPAVALPGEDSSFFCRIRAGDVAGGAGCWLESTGACGQATRKVSVGFSLTNRVSSVFKYAVASRGKISLQGNAMVIGMVDPGDGAMLSTRDSSPAISVEGSADVGGRLDVTGTSTDYIYLAKGGGYTVCGSSDREEILDNYVAYGVRPPEFPEPDVSPFEAFAVNPLPIDSHGNVTGGTYDNIRVPANTNPTFTADTVLRGVVYIEQPNKVSFRGGATVQGVIVTEESPIEDLTNCTISFAGNFSAPGVESLPNTPQWQSLRELDGSVIVAPGFSLSFNGNCSSINGVIAGNKIEFTGNSNVEGSMTGCILGLKDNDMIFGGSADVRVQRQSSDTTPAGFSHPMGLLPVLSTYVEAAP